MFISVDTHEFLATSWENLFMLYVNNKGADQPAHPRSLISAFVVHCLASIIPLLSISEISSLYLASVAAQAGSCLTWSQTPKTGFLVTRLIWATSLETLPSKVCDQVRHEPAFSGTESSKSWNWALSQENLSLGFATRVDSKWPAQPEKLASLELVSVASIGIILSRQWTTKALMRLHGCAGWPAPLLFTCGKKRFSHDGAQFLV